MIRAEFLVTQQGVLTGFHLRGHAGYAGAGQDVICAFVSSAAYMTANTITDVMMLDAEAEATEGDMLFRMSEKNAVACQELLKGLKLHLENTEEQYPACLKVILTEV